MTTTPTGTQLLATGSAFYHICKKTKDPPETSGLASFVDNHPRAVGATPRAAATARRAIVFRVGSRGIQSLAVVWGGLVGAGGPFRRCL